MINFNDYTTEELQELQSQLQVHLSAKEPTPPSLHFAKSIDITSSTHISIDTLSPVLEMNYRDAKDIAVSYFKQMKTDAEKLIEATLKHTLRPKKEDRKEVIISVLEFIIKEYGYMVETYEDWVIDVVVLEQLIEELRTVDEVSTVYRRRELNVL